MRLILRENPNEVGDYIANYICKRYVPEPISEPLFDVVHIVTLTLH